MAPLLLTKGIELLDRRLGVYLGHRLELWLPKQSSSDHLYQWDFPVRSRSTLPMPGAWDRWYDHRVEVMQARSQGGLDSHVFGEAQARRSCRVDQHISKWVREACPIARVRLRSFFSERNILRYGKDPNEQGRPRSGGQHCTFPISQVRLQLDNLLTARAYLAGW